MNNYDSLFERDNLTIVSFFFLCYNMVVFDEEWMFALHFSDENA